MGALRFGGCSAALGTDARCLRAAKRSIQTARIELPTRRLLSERSIVGFASDMVIHWPHGGWGMIRTWRKQTRRRQAGSQTDPPASRDEGPQEAWLDRNRARNGSQRVAADVTRRVSRWKIAGASASSGRRLHFWDADWRDSQPLSLGLPCIERNENLVRRSC